MNSATSRAPEAPGNEVGNYPRVSIVDVSFRYTKSGPDIFTGVTHNFPQGVMTAITGPSGTGKSTLLYLIGLLLTPSAGYVEIGGEKLSSTSDYRRSLVRAADIGMVFQDSELDPTRTIIDSVIEPSIYTGGDRKRTRDKATALLESFGLADRSSHRPGEISGGQAQRVAVCRALINSPAVVLADEPTGNLDRGNSELVLDALQNAAAAGRTVLIATHDPYVLKFCDHRVDL